MARSAVSAQEEEALAAAIVARIVAPNFNIEDLASSELSRIAGAGGILSQLATMTTLGGHVQRNAMAVLRAVQDTNVPSPQVSKERQLADAIAGFANLLPRDTRIPDQIRPQDRSSDSSRRGGIVTSSGIISAPNSSVLSARAAQTKMSHYVTGPGATVLNLSLAEPREYPSRTRESRSVSPRPSRRHRRRNSSRTRRSRSRSRERSRRHRRRSPSPRYYSHRDHRGRRHGYQPTRDRSHERYGRRYRS